MMIPDLPAASGRASVVGVLLNHRSAWDALAPRMTQDPYKAPPKAPVLYLKPANTWAASGAAVALPANAQELVMGATLGILIGRATTGVSAAQALDCVAGYLLVNDVTVPHDSVYRPPLKFNCRDAYCPMGPVVASAPTIGDPGNLVIHTEVNGQPVSRNAMRELVRPVAQLLADISDFMTLHPGDVLMAGVAQDAARARAGDRVRIHAAGLGELLCSIVHEGSAS